MIFAICASVVKASQPICQKKKKSEVGTVEGSGAFCLTRWKSMPFHHSPSTGELWCGRVLPSSRHFYSHQLWVGFICWDPFLLFYYHSRVAQEPRRRPRRLFCCKNVSDIRPRERKALIYLFIYLDAHARWHSDVSRSAFSSQAPLTLVIGESSGSWPQ